MFTPFLAGTLTDVTQQRQLKGAALHTALVQARDFLLGLKSRCVLLWADTSIDWVLMDLAALVHEQLIVPYPLFASAQQMQHTLQQVQPDYLLTDQPVDLGTAPWFGFVHVADFGSLRCYRSPFAEGQPAIEVPQHTQKITFTSGSTGLPKGVCLSAAQQLRVAQSLVSRIALPAPRHCCLLPLSLLLENIAGIYAPLLAGGEVLLCSDQARGFVGSQLHQPARLLALLNQVQPHSLILVPELLQLLLQACRQGWKAPTTLKFIAVGGARIAPDMLQEALQYQLPVYPGYGLSECGSVVTLATSCSTATPNEDRMAVSVGQTLEHVQVRIIEGEVQVKTEFLGYLGQPAQAMTQQQDEQGERWIRTGDVGYWTADAELVIAGRSSNLLVSSHGRNISPEWLESELTKSGQVQQAVVFGDSQPFCVALLFAADPMTESMLRAWVHQLNQQLPDYARIQHFYRLSQPFSPQQGTLTTNGRPRRAAIATLYQAELQQLFSLGAHPLCSPFLEAGV